LATKYYTVSTGNWSSAANWNNGTIPQAGDNVYANGKTVTIDQNIVVAKISSEVCPDTGVGGGEFRITTDRTIVANIITGSTQCVQIATSNITLVLAGDIHGGNGTSARGLYINQANININITGNVYGGTGSVGAYGIVMSSSYTNISINITGTVYGGVGSRGVVIQSGVVNVVGFVYADSFSAIVADTINIIGEVWGSSSATAIAEYTSGAGICSIAGLVYNTGARMAITTTRVVMSNETLCGWRFYDIADTNVILYSETYIALPQETDVRVGVAYGITRAGKCAVPPKASVSLNVPVDNTVGELVTATTPSDFITALKADALGLRLAECSTVDNTADILEAIAAIPTPDPGASPSEFVEALKADELGARLSNCSTVAITGAQIAGATPPEA